MAAAGASGDVPVSSALDSDKSVQEKIAEAMQPAFDELGGEIICFYYGFLFLLTTATGCASSSCKIYHWLGELWVTEKLCSLLAVPLCYILNRHMAPGRLH